MLMILGERRDNYRAELIYNKRYPNHSRKFHIVFCHLRNRFL